MIKSRGAIFRSPSHRSLSRSGPIPGQIRNKAVSGTLGVGSPTLSAGLGRRCADRAQDRGEIVSETMNNIKCQRRSSYSIEALFADLLFAFCARGLELSVRVVHCIASAPRCDSQCFTPRTIRSVICIEGNNTK